MPSFSIAELGLIIGSFLAWKGNTELLFTSGESRRMFPLAEINGSKK